MRLRLSKTIDAGDGYGDQSLLEKPQMGCLKKPDAVDAGDAFKEPRTSHAGTSRPERTAVTAPNNISDKALLSVASCHQHTCCSPFPCWEAGLSMGHKNSGGKLTL